MKKLLVCACIALLYSCSSSSSDEVLGPGQEGVNPPVVNLEWSIPKTEVFDGGPGKDGIPALDHPKFTNVQNIDYLNDTDLVIGIKNGEEIKAYPHAILDWHEIVNDNISNVLVAVTYCPLTGTGIGWNRRVKGTVTTFGVSGLLYNTNLIPYDRATGSNWSQILNESVNGSLIGEKIDLISLFETDWKTWKSLFPNSQILSSDTGFSRTYGVSPYGDYNTNNSRFLFPVAKDPRLPAKERVHAIIDDEDAKTYRFASFTANNIIRDSFKGKEYIIVGNVNFIVSFQLNAEESSLNFEYVYNGSESLIKDSEGNEWNIFGEAISGPKAGGFLESSSSFMGFWFSIPAFYNTEIYGN
ncbi:DUF3179 domain-containing protein [Arenibacter sp. S6351L]|uniref:DUF3179 domain-containing protein n=1 Tax=Arenibacter sp. S6351L TaxID=2926407 RepID=UPI001FF13A97|nr:DUF3179 domain-containing protein [Arenibacter sp. S6351L]MCK0135920.1 DUF3179 domain-containing protein [Arenibacter sp. S6351L]